MTVTNCVWIFLTNFQLSDLLSRLYITDIPFSTKFVKFLLVSWPRSNWKKHVFFLNSMSRETQTHNIRTQSARIKAEAKNMEATKSKPWTFKMIIECDIFEKKKWKKNFSGSRIILFCVTFFKVCLVIHTRSGHDFYFINSLRNNPMV